MSCIARSQLFYHNASFDGRVCDGTGEDDTCSRQYADVLCNVYDHLHYFGETIGEDGCKPGAGANRTGGAEAPAVALEAVAAASRRRA